MTLTLQTLLFEPLLPWWLLAVLVGPVFMVGVLNRKMARIVMAVVVLAVVANPMIQQKTLKPENDVVVVIEDTSPSNQAQPRGTMTKAATTNIKNQLANIKDLDVIHLQTNGTTAAGSDLFAQTHAQLSNVPKGRLSAIIAITDGELTALPPTQALPNAPLHIVHTSPENLFDRRLIVHQAPTFALLGTVQNLTLEVQDSRHDFVTLTQIIGEKTTTHTLKTNQKQTLTFALKHGGSTAIRLSVPTLEDELTNRNNTATQLVTGVRENLNVLLVSGLPHNGTQVIRGLLKSDPAINLVHFTILRTRHKMDPTPDANLALIPFPVDDLFTKDLKKFDLIIFDRYIKRGLLTDQHFKNIVQHVEEGHALLVLAGPDYDSPFELPASPLQNIMPVRPIGPEKTTPYRPLLTPTGKRHPMTAPFAQNAATWGRFASVLPSQQTHGHSLMQTPDGLPLLVTSAQKAGRVAVWLSNNWWFWRRGIDGGGPQVALMRRLAHFLMGQADLAERQFKLSMGADELAIRYQDIDEPKTVNIEVRTPEGETKPFTLTQKEQWGLTIPAPTDGLYTVKTANGAVVAYGVRGQVRDLEWRSTNALEHLKNLTKATGGAFVPAKKSANLHLRRMGMQNRRLHGPGWVGLPQKNSTSLEGTHQKPLLPPWLGLSLILLALTSGWWLEAVRVKQRN